MDEIIRKLLTLDFLWYSGVRFFLAIIFTITLISYYFFKKSNTTFISVKFNNFFSRINLSLTFYFLFFLFANYLPYSIMAIAMFNPIDKSIIIVIETIIFSALLILGISFFMKFLKIDLAFKFWKICNFFFHVIITFIYFLHFSSVIEVFTFIYYMN